MVDQIIREIQLSKYDLILLPGFVQWDSTALEKKYSIKIRKGPEFASDIPTIIENLPDISLSNKIPANKLFETSGEKEYQNIIKKQYRIAKDNLSHHTF